MGKLLRNCFFEQYMRLPVGNQLWVKIYLITWSAMLSLILWELCLYWLGTCRPILLGATAAYLKTRGI
jgi:hypothetical protein